MNSAPAPVSDAFLTGPGALVVAESPRWLAPRGLFSHGVQRILERQRPWTGVVADQTAGSSSDCCCYWHVLGEQVVARAPPYATARSYGSALFRRGQRRNKCLETNILTGADETPAQQPSSTSPSNTGLASERIRRV